MEQQEKKYIPPLKAIRHKCLECSGGSFNEVENCVVTKCPLFDYRFGKNPFRKKVEKTEEQMEAMRARGVEALRRYKEQKKETESDEDETFAEADELGELQGDSESDDPAWWE